MKKIFFTVLFLILIATPSLALWNDCPYGEVNCEGECGRFIDTDDDGYCDHSQLAPEDRVSDDIEEDNEEHISDTNNENIEYGPTTGKIKENKYIFVPVAVFLIVFYIITHVLSHKNIISIASHRKFWNVLLLLTFLGVGLSGIFLILRINYGLNIHWPFNLLYWHVETGIAMALISIFHTFWHFPYFKNIFKFRKK